ncbi:ATP-binding cassette domain-containing protein [Arthrobacter sp. TS-15]|uniref:ATP-binding cassette domain-containing protein n=1 Tax=unclassified Arthrobacter TaxID=235627 RepID=UPI00115EE585|nr:MULTISPECIES: ATP-binding cassette domain-containing protein [unclassified Arthrobacter]TQS94087.1 ATP-binding cassette domain-containing protein [Arthrobacter sp. TS-15]BCW61437.1 daunorubicin resistance protein DrrA family ABC transporter ATP-binding protein [Arthrobacter sp. StoSoilB22]
MIRVDNVRKSYGSFTALDGLSLDAPEGTVLGLLGPNGSGKTTTVKVLTTLLTPDSGDAWVAGHSVRTDPELVRRNLGLSGQYAAVDEKLTAFENLHMVGRLYGMNRRNATARAHELLADFRLTDVAGKRAGAFSGGMRRRLDLAGAVVARPKVVVLDEPTTGLDPRGRLDTWDVVAGLVSGGTTVLLTTQYLEEADRLADHIAVINHGSVIAEGTASQLKDRAGSERVDVTVKNAADLRSATSVLMEATGGVVIPEVDEAALSVSVAAPGGHGVLVRVLAELDARSLPVTEASLRRPTLDDVFLQLTGGSTQTPHQNSEDKQGVPA